jgi:MFS family permease
LLQAIENLTWMLTPPLAGILLGVWGPNPAYMVNAVSFVVSALFLVRIPGSLLQAGRAQSRGHVEDILEGFRTILHTRVLLAVFVAWNVFFVAIAGVNVAQIALAKVALDSGDFGYGLLIGATGIGLVTGSYLAATITERVPMGLVYGSSIATIAVGVAAAASSPTVWLAAACMAAVGFGNGVAVVCNALFVQRGAPDEVRGRVFTVLMSSNYAVLGISMAIAGPLTDAIGPRLVWGLAAAVFGCSAVLAFLLTPRLRPQAAPLTREHPA